ncbi:hypothetical protein GQ53DRAFT_528292 [Thozetella sp. PMI_491]|nr:hypothetical protein GQ53DRAFT_528292 [Thozetella sp. PMI_491]
MRHSFPFFYAQLRRLVPFRSRLRKLGSPHCSVVLPRCSAVSAPPHFAHFDKRLHDRLWAMAHGPAPLFPDRSLVQKR